MKKILLRSLFFILCGALVFNFIAVFVITFPDNALRKIFIKHFTAYIGYGVLAQNWTLFAPQPAITNFHFYVKCTLKNNENTAIWLNVSDGMYNSLHANIFGPYVRLIRFYTTGGLLQLSEHSQDDSILVNFAQSICTGVYPAQNTTTVQYKLYANEVSGFKIEGKKYVYTSKIHNYEYKAPLYVQSL